MKTKLFLQIGGIINLLFVAFHLLSAWTPGLAVLPVDFRPVMQVLNIHLAYALAIFFVVSFFFPDELSATKMGRLISLSIAGFWILRGVNQLVFWDVSSVAWIILLVCFGIGMLYILPVTRRVAQG
ncbi:MAG TPA: hypothetical protein VFQ13_11010 [Anaerolineales bacterium]|nr:hypothetical protein [Anaerolineales bacterium]